jgi:hypothetical protein
MQCDVCEMARDEVEDPELIAFEETIGMSPAEIYAAIRVDPDSPLPQLYAGHVDVTGVTGVLLAGGAEIPIEEMQHILPWPVRPRRP